ncbi:transposase [Hymenobacter nivis]|uniref:Tc1-like transposase DDE domain-containing protein n=1 Tax=Hymenobacter nivis TaxID=1850093 RepID=A0A2Z3GDW0_9BACT|nr:transposase [Hymenobacter nivis]AWM31653.1 hypothetical protein DDQ68_01910 [Hymenobacter nivis]
MDSKALQAWLLRTCRVAYSLSGLTDLLHRLSFTYKLTMPVPCQADAAAQAGFLDELAVLGAHVERGEAVLYYADAAHNTRIYVICDNARHYKNKELRACLADKPICQVFLPPYSPNLNLIERFWKFLRQKIINTTFCRTKDPFRTAVLGFFDRLPEFGLEREDNHRNQSRAAATCQKARKETTVFS